MTADLLRVEVPALYCDCGNQVALSDAVGRSTAPTYRDGATDELVCLWCAREHLDPAELHPLRVADAGWVPGEGTPVDGRDAFELLLRLGATVTEPAPVRKARRGQRW